MSYTYEEQLKLVKGSTRGLTDSQAERITWRCIEARKLGRNPAVWHQMSLYFGTPCNCAPCAKARVVGS